jgi:hypothetical protein
VIGTDCTGSSKSNWLIDCFVIGTSRAKLCDEGIDTVWVLAKTYTSTGNSFTVKMVSDDLETRNGVGFIDEGNPSTRRKSLT